MKGLEFGNAFKYPFNRPAGMLNILWLLLPIFGWFAIGGYKVRIVNEWLSGKTKQLPKMSFGSDLKLGFMMFLKFIPFFIVYMIASMIIGLIPVLGALASLFLGLFVVPILVINFIKKQTVESAFEFKKVESVFKNFGEYILALVMDIVLGIIFMVLSIVLVGIPAGSFTKNIFIANFYRRFVK